MPNSHARHKPGEVCPRCKFVHRTHWGGNACVGHKRNGAACKQPPVDEMNVCRTHGGNAPQTKALAAQRETAHEVEKIVKGILATEERTPDPIADMHRVMVRAQVLADYLEGEISQLKEWRFVDAKGSEQLNSYVALYERALDRVQKFSLEYLRLGLEAKMVKLEEDKVALVVRAFQAAVIEVGLSSSQSAAVRESFARLLREFQ